MRNRPYQWEKVAKKGYDDDENIEVLNYSNRHSDLGDYADDRCSGLNNCTGNNKEKINERKKKPSNYASIK